MQDRLSDLPGDEKEDPQGRELARRAVRYCVGGSLVHSAERCECGWGMLEPRTAGYLGDAIAVLVHGDVAALAEDNVVGCHTEATAAHRAQGLLVLLAAGQQIYQLRLNRA